MPVDFFTHFSALNDPRDDKNKRNCPGTTGQSVRS